MFKGYLSESGVTQSEPLFKITGPLPKRLMRITWLLAPCRYAWGGIITPSGSSVMWMTPLIRTMSGAYGFNDQVGGNGSQHRVKYGHKQGNTDWNFPATATASVTLRSLYGSRVINNGDVVTSANLKSWCNIDAPTPELVQCDRSSYAGYFLAGANRLCETLFKLTPNPLYDYAGNQAARDPYMKKLRQKCGAVRAQVPLLVRLTAVSVSARV